MSEVKFDEQFERAEKAGEEANRTEARAVSAKYEPDRKMIVIELKNGGPFAFPVAWVSRLRGASEADLEAVEITPSGEGLHWENLDEDLSIPALINGVYGPDRFDATVLNRLAAELESAWFTEKDPAVIDRLAEANPLYAAELYEVFGSLVQAELDAGQSGNAESAQVAREWLEKEGLAEVHKIVKDANESGSSLTPSPDPTPSPEPAPVDVSLEETGQTPESNVLAFPDLLKERLGIDPDDAYEAMGLPEDLVYVVQQQPPGEQPRVKNEIAERAAARYGLQQAEVAAALNSQWQRAARHRASGPGPSFRQQLAIMEMSDENERKLWLHLADEEE